MISRTCYQVETSTSRKTVMEASVPFLVGRTMTAPKADGSSSSIKTRSVGDDERQANPGFPIQSLSCYIQGQSSKPTRHPFRNPVAMSLQNIVRVGYLSPSRRITKQGKLRQKTGCAESSIIQLVGSCNLGVCRQPADSSLGPRFVSADWTTTFRLQPIKVADVCI